MSTPDIRTTTFDPARIAASLEAQLCSRPLAILEDYADAPLNAVDASGFGDDAPSPYERHGDVAVVEISGLLLQRAFWLCGFEMIAGYDTIGARMRAAFEDDAVGSVLAVIDSPGGDCAGCAELADALAMWSRESGKSLTVYANELVASAAYWLASSASEIVTPRTGRLGSIGTVAMVYNVAGALEATGRRAIVAASPPGKLLAASSVVPMTDGGVAVRERLQSMCNELTAIFAGHVSQARGLKVDDVMAMQAGVYLGQSAVSVKLADRVGGQNLALDVAQSKIKKREYSMGAEGKTAGAAVFNLLKMGGFKAAGDAEPVEPAQIEQAAKETARLAEIGAALERETSASGDAAIETIRAWRDGHARVPALERRVKTEALRGRFADRVPPAEAFGPAPATLFNGNVPHPSAGLPHPDGGPHERYDVMSLDVFDARMAASTVHPTTVIPAVPKHNANGSLTNAERDECVRNGFNEDDYKAAAARLFGGG